MQTAPSAPRFRCNRCLSAAAVVLVLLFQTFSPTSATAREEVWEDELQYEARTQINFMIKSLNASYDNRQKYVQELVELSKGKLRQLVIRQLRSAMGKRDAQITEAIIEIFSHINDPAIIPVFEEELLYSPASDVRLEVILHLPLFCVPSATDRESIQSLLEAGERHLPQNLVAALRSPPFNPQTGRYDISLDEDIRGRVESALTWQLDPVEALIVNGLEQRNQDRALKMLKRLLDIDLGHSRNSWLEFWRSRGRNFESPLQDEILEAQINACRMLGFLGAEGTEDLCARLSWLMTTPYENARQAGLEMLASCLEQAHNEKALWKERQADPKIRQPEELWIKRRIASAIRLRQLTYTFATEYLNDNAEVIRLALVDCLGATRQPEAVPFLGEAMRNDGQSMEMRMHAAKALGKIGGLVAEQLLEQMASFKGIAVSRELQIDEYQRVREAFDSLGNILGSIHDGRLITDNQQASERAFQFILTALADDRSFPGAPPHLPEEEKRVKFLARELLRSCLGNLDDPYDAASWQAVYRKAQQAPEQVR